MEAVNKSIEAFAECRTAQQVLCASPLLPQGWRSVLLAVVGIKCKTERELARVVTTCKYQGNIHAQKLYLGITFRFTSHLAFTWPSALVCRLRRKKHFIAV